MPGEPIKNEPLIDTVRVDSKAQIQTEEKKPHYYFIYERPKIGKDISLSSDEFAYARHLLKAAYWSVDRLPKAGLAERETVFHRIGRMEAALLVQAKSKGDISPEKLLKAKQILDEIFDPSRDELFDFEKRNPQNKIHASDDITQRLDLEDRAGIDPKTSQYREPNLDCQQLADIALNAVDQYGDRALEPDNLARATEGIVNKRLHIAKPSLEKDITANKTKKDEEIKRLFDRFDPFTLGIMTSSLPIFSQTDFHFGHIPLYRLRTDYQQTCRDLLTATLKDKKRRENLTVEDRKMPDKSIPSNISWVEVADRVVRSYEETKLNYPLYGKIYGLSIDDSGLIVFNDNHAPEPVIHSSSFGQMQVLSKIDIGSAISSDVRHARTTRVKFLQPIDTPPERLEQAKNYSSQTKALYQSLVDEAVASGTIPIETAQLATQVGDQSDSKLGFPHKSTTPAELGKKEVLLVEIPYPAKDDPARGILDREKQFLGNAPAVFREFISLYGHCPVPRLLYDQTTGIQTKTGTSEYTANWVRMYEAPPESIKKHFFKLEPFQREGEAVSMLSQFCTLLENLKAANLTLKNIDYATMDDTLLNSLCWNGKKLVLQDSSLVEPIEPGAKTEDIDRKQVDLIGELMLKTLFSGKHPISSSRELDFSGDYDPIISHGAPDLVGNYYLRKTPLETAPNMKYFSERFQTVVQAVLSPRPQDRLTSVESIKSLLDPIVRYYQLAPRELEALALSLAGNPKEMRNSATYLQIAKNIHNGKLASDFENLLTSMRAHIRGVEGGNLFKAGKEFLAATDSKQAVKYFQQALEQTPAQNIASRLRCKRGLRLAKILAQSTMIEHALGGSDKYSQLKWIIEWLVDNIENRLDFAAHDVKYAIPVACIVELQKTMIEKTDLDSPDGQEAYLQKLDRLEQDLADLKLLSAEIEIRQNMKNVLDLIPISEDSGRSKHQAALLLKRCVKLVKGHPDEELFRKEFGDFEVLVEMEEQEAIRLGYKPEEEKLKISETFEFAEPDIFTSAHMVARRSAPLNLTILGQPLNFAAVERYNPRENNSPLQNMATQMAEVLQNGQELHFTQALATSFSVDEFRYNLGNLLSNFSQAIGGTFEPLKPDMIVTKDGIRYCYYATPLTDTKAQKRLYRVALFNAKNEFVSVGFAVKEDIVGKQKKAELKLASKDTPVLLRMQFGYPRR